MAYRSDLEALAARHAALEAEVASKTRARDEVGRMLDEARQRDELDRVAADYAAGGPRMRRNRRIAIGIFASIAMLMIGGMARHHLSESDEVVRMRRAVATFDRFTDEACQCRDKACVDAVMDRLTKWGTEMAKEYPMKEPYDPELTKQMTVIAERFTKCVTAVYTTQPTQAEATE